MKSHEIRALALSMPQAIESSHMGHPDFRVRHSDVKTRIFASLFVPFDDHEKREWAMVKLTPKQQQEFCKAAPKLFQPVRGGWGKQGAMQIRLEASSRPARARTPAGMKSIRNAVIAAWRNAAPKRLVEDVPAKRSRSRR